MMDAAIKKALTTAARTVCCGAECAQEKEGLQCAAPVDGVRTAVAIVLDFVKDNPTEEMLKAGRHAIDARVDREGELDIDCESAAWREMCLALRRGVAGDG